MNFQEWIRHPFPWYVAGPLMGLMVPLLMVLGNKSLGISSSLRTVCAACIPARVAYFRYPWKYDKWNLFFVLGLMAGGTCTWLFMHSGGPLEIQPSMQAVLGSYGLGASPELVPRELFNWKALLTPEGWVLMVGGGFLVGFGSRYAGGCTSGHALTGLVTLQWPSLAATCCFFAGGCIATYFVLPVLLTR